LHNFHRELGESQKLPFSEGSFDVAVMALVISFLPIQTKRSQKWRAWRGLGDGLQPTFGIFQVAGRQSTLFT